MVRNENSQLVYNKRRTMFKNLAVLVLISVAFADPIPTLVAEDAPNTRGRIAIETVPYQVSISLKGDLQCSGTILSEDWILTAAGCLHGPSSAFSVRAGSANSTYGGSIHNVSRFIQHERFGESSVSGYSTHNVALIRVATPLTMDAIRKPIELYKSGEKTSERTTGSISGYGKIRNSPQVGYFLLTQDVTIISKKQCKESYTLGHDEVSQLCAEYVRNEVEDLCQYNAGAPLTVNGRVAGIIVGGIGCPSSSARRPIIYTDVGFFRDWIKEHSGL